MSKTKKFFKILLFTVVSLLALIIIAGILAYAYFKFFIFAKLPDTSDAIKENGISVTDVAKDFSDKQIIDNILNFDKQTAVEMLAALTELGKEVNPGDKTESEKDAENKADTGVQIPQEGKTAYQRIMNEASKDEISLGMSILSKIDMAKVNELRKQGKTGEIKEYLKSVLTQQEISAALSLYNKYKHLL